MIAPGSTVIPTEHQHHPGVRQRVQQIHKKAANLDALVENLDGYVWSVDTEMRYIVLNSTLVKLIKDVIGVEARPGDRMLDILEILNPAKKNEWNAFYLQAFQGNGQRFVSQFEIEGKPAYFEVAINPMREEGIVKGISCFARNVTESLHNSRMLQESELRFRSLIENCADFIMMANGVGEFIYGSPSVKRYLGYSDEEYLYKSVFTFIHPDSIADSQKLLGALSLNPGKPFTIYLKLLHKNGHEVWVEGIATNLLETPGIQALVANFRDIGERQKSDRLLLESEELRRELMEEKLLRQTEIMQAAMDAQEQERAYIGRELHDNVKQVLSTAKAYLEYGREKPAEQLDMIGRAETIISQAINELRELSRSLIQVFRQEIGLQLSIENLLDSIRLGKPFAIVANFDLANEQLISDKLKMTIFRILQEHMTNIQVHAQATQVCIALVQSEQELTLNVTDDGRGFDLRQPRKGIGLTNIYHRVEIFNGQINLQSSPGNGCRLAVSFKI
ncbi:PAS domain-containing sensor histidine kinase [Paraflavitalea pollutisoli]|uniref:PAS domain-containing sensor histidine kinase n=1 Tax=Paraflavitalea pollutisoli TaxID=3034143 RepID=UPI0023EC8109|nr:PAS domain S-box protein [Paraflavitalea sp. H1-2-19X]